jgi:hypothetical protein
MKESKENLPNLIAMKQIEPILPILEWAYFKRLAPDLVGGEPQTPEEKIIALLADLIISLNFEAIPIDEKQKEYITMALPEIQKIYLAMKKEVGFSGHGNKESLLHPTVLRYFDEHRNEFFAIKREDLDHKPLFKLTGGQEKRDFHIKLLRQMLYRQFGEIITFAEIKHWLASVQP